MEFSENQESDGVFPRIDGSFGNSYTIISFLINILMEEIKLVVFEEDELEYWDLSILINFLPQFNNQDSIFDVTDKLQEL